MFNALASRINPEDSAPGLHATSHIMSTIRTFTLHFVEVPDPNGGEAALTDRPLKVTAGSQALYPEFAGSGKTLLRFETNDTCRFLESAPKMRVKIDGNPVASSVSNGSVIIDDVRSVELLFDNRSFLSEQKEMPFWLIEGLEYAAKKLREEYALNQEGGLWVEEIE